jgi:hypothetical protein
VTASRRGPRTPRPASRLLMMTTVTGVLPLIGTSRSQIVRLRVARARSLSTPLWPFIYLTSWGAGNYPHHYLSVSETQPVLQ